MNHTTKRNRLSNHLEVLQVPGWTGDCNISHFITTRFGGVSEGNYAGMNAGLYTDDDPQKIRQNRELLGAALHIPVQKLITPHQVHGCQVRIIDDAFMLLPEKEQIRTLDGVDALVTDLEGVCVTVATADCVPVLLYAPDKQVIAAIHAGWRGTVQGIVRRTVALLKEKYGCEAGKMRALIGPSISQLAFEVGEEVVASFRQSQAWTREEAESLFQRNPQTQKTHIDLWKANQLQLLHEGLIAERIYLTGICTYQHAEEFFSARRLGVHSGRILSGLFINKESKR